MRALIHTAFVLMILGGAFAAPSLAQAENGSAVLPSVSKILVEKAARKLYLLRGDERIKEYDISLGWAPDGPKQQEGDGRTPEGQYAIVRRNPRSLYHKSLEISYPNAADVARAREQGLSPGGQIMIHGIGKKKDTLKRVNTMRDWTAGCIAVSDDQIREIWALVGPGVPVEIRP